MLIDIQNPKPFSRLIIGIFLISYIFSIIKKKKWKNNNIFEIILKNVIIFVKIIAESL